MSDRNILVHDFGFSAPGWSRRKRLAVIWGVVLLVLVAIFVVTWNSFFVYVPPGKHLIVIAKNGDPLDSGEVLARDGQKGIQREVRGEGWHFIMPIIYTTELGDNTLIPAGKVGIVTARGGRLRPEGKELADEGEQGIQRHVLAPGTYRINRYGFDVEVADATEIKPGYVGVLRRMLGSPGTGTIATDNTDQKGILRHVLQPGLYFINTKEFEVTRAEVGIFQTSFRVAPEDTQEKGTAITFVCKGGFPISMDCTVEWEILPEQSPMLMAEYGKRSAIEKNVIDVQAHAIGRDKGIDYGVQDFLEGKTREKFQDDFTKELVRVCKEKNLMVHSAFIRRIDIPEPYLKPIRDKKIAEETQLTTKAKEVTAQVENMVEKEERMVEQEVSKVEAETKLLVANIDQEISNVKVRNDAEIEKLKADYANRIATLDSERRTVTGKAQAQATKLKETAKNGLFSLKMDVFQNDASAYFRYALADHLNPDLVLRLFHAGQGTFWTNMDSKNLNLMLPAPMGNGTKDKLVGPPTPIDLKTTSGVIRQGKRRCSGFSSLRR